MKDIRVRDLKRTYDSNFKPSQEYLDGMPDLQNSQFEGIPIDFVGIDGIHLPVKIAEKDGSYQDVIASFTGTVSLSAAARGINMSRILRTLYKSKDDIFDIDKLEEVLRNYQKDLKSFDAHILMNFKYRIWQDALVSVDDNDNKEGGWQYYNVTFDTNLDATGEFKKIMWFDYVYSSACPCSTELSLYNAYQEGVYCIPHSQRSVARIGIEFTEDVWIEDLLNMCREVIPTEVQVFVKRQDEGNFAWLNGANPIFVEDAIRKLSVKLNDVDRITDYKIVCCHSESLHAHNAIAVITKGIRGSIFNHHVTLGEYSDIKHSIA